MRTWQLQDAKARLSEVVKKAEKEGPQVITVHGHSTAVVISSKEYMQLKKPKGSFVSFMRQSPLFGVKLDLTREQTSTRGADVK
jgi:antitoxin Phd